MKNIILLFGILGLIPNSYAQESKPKSKVERVVIEYRGKKVIARQLTVSCEIPMDLDIAWANVKTPALLEFVAKRMIRFKAVDSDLPKQWELGKTYGVKMRVFGFMPFGGIHYLLIKEIDEENYKIASQEWDKRAKIWNHNIELRNVDDRKIYYEDSVTIYGGVMTGFITSFAKRFYVHRQKRWQIVAKEKLNFAQ